ncbi:hypothetical protein [Streptomyces decoyicus]|uniref:hypothetical protein n=1 Tax=Streptomyces decoyicus TaxID=249567 RepID=UPI0004AAE75E|nr:hypothetical protein ADK74_21030 [Streptomyces decoyicus]QZY19960.1 hypothetical protein K7C20_35975 [Streptomyces decoyicus]
MGAESVGVQAVDQAVEESGERGVRGGVDPGRGEGFGELRVVAVVGDGGEVAGFAGGSVG